MVVRQRARGAARGLHLRRMPHPRVGPAAPRAGWAQGPCGARAHQFGRGGGWYLGKIKLFGVSAAWKRACPSANFIVKYTKRETSNMLDGDSALELEAHNYGRDEWWLLLDPVAE